MNTVSSLILVALAVLVVTLLVSGLFSYFSPEAKAERRLRKSSGPIISKARRPMVKFSVRTDKKD